MTTTAKLTIIDQRVSKTASLLTTLLAASSASGAIVTSGSLGLSGFTVSSGMESPWDIDGDGSSEAVFNARVISFTVDFTSFTSNVLSLSTGLADNHALQLQVWETKLSNVQSLANIPYIYSRQAMMAPDQMWLAVDGQITHPKVDVYVGSAVSSFLSGEMGYIGFSFDHEGTTCYGWAEFTITSGGDFGSVTIGDWAFEDSGAPIGVGSTVPEPASAAAGLGLLALGAAGVRRWRKQKQA